MTSSTAHSKSFRSDALFNSTFHPDSVVEHDSMDGLAERLHRSSQIVYKRLAEFNSDETATPLLSNDSNTVRVYSLGPLKSQPLAGPRLVAVANFSFPWLDNNPAPALAQQMVKAFFSDRAQWDTTRHPSSGVLRSVRAKQLPDGTDFRCEIVRAATNSVCGGLISPREFLCAEGTWISSDNQMAFTCGFSLDSVVDAEARMAVPAGFVRGIAHPSGYLFHRVSADRFAFLYTVHAQPGGSIPISIVNDSAPAELFRVVCNFVDYVHRTVRPLPL